MTPCILRCRRPSRSACKSPSVNCSRRSAPGGGDGSANERRSYRSYSSRPMNFQAELETLIRARYPILYLVSSEEMRVQHLVIEIAKKRQKKAFEWSYSTGIVPAGTSIQSQKHRNAATKEPLLALEQVIEQVE